MGVPLFIDLHGRYFSAQGVGEWIKLTMHPSARLPRGFSKLLDPSYVPPKPRDYSGPRPISSLRLRGPHHLKRLDCSYAHKICPTEPNIGNICTSGGKSRSSTRVYFDRPSRPHYPIKGPPLPPVVGTKFSSRNAIPGDLYAYRLMRRSKLTGPPPSWDVPICPRPNSPLAKSLQTSPPAPTSSVT